MWLVKHSWQLCLTTHTSQSSHTHNRDDTILTTHTSQSSHTHNGDDTISWHRTFIVTLIKSEFLVQIIVSILFAGSYVLMHANLCNCASSCKMLAYCRFCRWISCIIIYLFLFSECSQTVIEFSLFTASHGSTSRVAIYCGWQYIDIFHSMEFLFTGFHGC